MLYVATNLFIANDNRKNLMQQQSSSFLIEDFVAWKKAAHLQTDNFLFLF